MTQAPAIGQVVVVRVTRAQKGPDTQYVFDYFHTNGEKNQGGGVVCKTPQTIWYLLENVQQDQIAMDGILFDGPANDICEIWADDNSIRLTNRCETAAIISIRLDFVDRRSPYRPVQFSSNDPQIINEPGNTGRGSA